MMFQAQALLTDLSVFDNVAFPLREHTALPAALIRDIVLMKLQAVGLRGARDLSPEQLSGGMSRRVALARAIAMDPDLAMYDEPFAGMDPITLGVLVRLIRTLNDSLGPASIVVSHSVDEVLSIADDVYVLADHRILAGGPPEAIRRSTNEYWRGCSPTYFPQGPRGNPRFSRTAKPSKLALCHPERASCHSTHARIPVDLPTPWTCSGTARYQT
jgi:phospholipid/cholesterol/gamma-HCH transport system ATP-binding protein